MKCQKNYIKMLIQMQEQIQTLQKELALMQIQKAMQIMEMYMMQITRLKTKIINNIKITFKAG